MGGTVFQGAEELMSDPPAKLTKAGLAMLTEIWIAAGRPAKPEVKVVRSEHGHYEDDGTTDLMVDIGELASHHGDDAKRRSAARVRVHLVNGGYLHLSVYSDMMGPNIIEDLGLSAKAFDALIEAGVIQPGAVIQPSPE